MISPKSTQLGSGVRVGLRTKVRRVASVSDQQVHLGMQQLRPNQHKRHRLPSRASDVREGFTSRSMW